jgi:hypothetical protein
VSISLLVQNIIDLTPLTRLLVDPLMEELKALPVLCETQITALEKEVKKLNKSLSSPNFARSKLEQLLSKMS